MAKYCPKCGKELPDGASFCASCGNQQPGSSSTEAAPKKAATRKAATKDLNLSERFEAIARGWILDKESIGKLANLPGSSQGFVALIVVAMIGGGAQALQMRAIPFVFSPALTFISRTIGLFIQTLISIGFLHLVAKKLFDGVGEFRNYLNAMSHLSLLPAVVMLIVVSIGSSISPGISILITIGISILIGIWAIVLNVVSIKVIYGFSTWKAIATIIVSVVLLFVIGAIIAIALIATVGLAMAGMGLY